VALNATEDTEVLFRLPKAEPTQVEYNEEYDSHDTNPEGHHCSDGDIGTGVHTECESENEQPEKQSPEEHPPEQQKLWNTSNGGTLISEALSNPR
jgi:hypothetical protein